MKHSIKMVGHNCIKIRSVLRLLYAEHEHMAWKYFHSVLLGILLFIYLRPVASNIGVHQGNLSDVDCSKAILSMSGDSIHKTTWWQFLPYLQFNPDTFISYLIFDRSGQCEEMRKQIIQNGRLLYTRNASIAEYKSVEKIPDLGTMELHMWVLGFVCVKNQSECHKITPVVRSHTQDGPAFFTLWEENTETGKFSTSTTSRVLQLQRDESQPLENEVIFNNFTGPELCAGTFDSATNQINVTGLDFTGATEAPRAAGFTLGKECPEPQSSTRPCLMGIDNSTDTGALQSVVRDENITRSFMVQVKNSYIANQNSALNLEQGPATSFWVAAIALPGSIIAVLTAASPLTNLQLRVARKVRLSQRVKVAVLCLCNSLLSIVSYSTVIAVLPDELQRQKEFHTWGLLADEIPITPSGLQVLVVAHGKSVYRSKVLLLVWISTALMLPMMSLITFWRCKQVFHRQRLLKKVREMQPNKDGNDNLDELHAIDMTAQEYKLLKKRFQTIKAQNSTESAKPNVIEKLYTRFLSTPVRIHPHQDISLHVYV